MHAWFIYVPTTDNGDRAVDVACLKIDALEVFRGLTVHPRVTGFWTSPDTGARYVDTLEPFEVATDDPEAVRAFARAVARRAAQEAVYVRGPDGSVELVTP